MALYTWPPIAVTASSGPVQYNLNGAATTVSQDTITPANSRALPVLNLNSSGAAVDPATSQKQDTGNTSLASIDGKTPGLGQALAAASSPVVLPASQITALTPPTTVTANQGAGGASAWKVDGSAVTQPVSGTVTVTQATAANLNATVSGTVAVSNQPTTMTVTQATAANLNATVTGTVAAAQSGTWTVQPGNTQNTTAWLTQDASDGPVGAGTAATKSMLGGGVFNTTLPTLTTGQQAAIQLDASGRQILGTSAAVIGAVTQSGTWNVATVTAVTGITNVVNVKTGGKTLGNAPVRIDYSSTVLNTSTYVQLVASTTAAITEIHFDDTGGYPLVIGTGGSGSETPLVILTPGANKVFPVTIASGTRLSVKALTTVPGVGDLCINMLN